MSPLGEVGLIVAAALVQQVVLSEFLPRLHELVDLYLIVVIYISVRRAQGHALVMGAATGLLQDVFNQTLIGVNSFSKCLVAFIVSGLGSRFMLNQPLPQFGALVVGTLMEYSIAAALMAVLGQKLSDPLILQRALANGVAGLMLFALIGRFTRRRTGAMHAG
ncbi:MAG: rod shape-determining protein MreD [Acidobacteriota bacterium]